MKRMKKITALVLCLLMTVSVFSTAEVYADVPTVAQTEVNIDDNQAVYSVKLNYDGRNDLCVKLADMDLFRVAPRLGLFLCGSKIYIEYDEGEYDVKAYLNPAQKMHYVEVVLPDGGIYRRGYDNAVKGNKLTSEVITVTSKNADCVVEEPTIEYLPITEESYTLNKTEPVTKGYSLNVYDVISSFGDAATSRYFAWTAKASYIGEDGEMALYYRVKGSDEWNEAKAQRREEKTTVAEEDYFFADLENLTPDTTYEYYIGKVGAASMSADGGAVYTFATSPKKIKSFDFVAIGDTQGVSWGGMTLSTSGDNGKGFMFADAAIKEAFEFMPNAAFMLHTGDIAEDGANINQWNYYFKALGDKAYSIPHFATNGNHDMYSISTEYKDFLFNYHFNHPNNGADAFDESVVPPANPRAATILKSHDEMTYSFNYGEAHFVVYNSGVYDNYNTPSTADNMRKGDEAVQLAQRAWLEADLEANKDARWTILLTHMPAYHRVGGIESSPWLEDVIEKYVDLAIMGHSHLVTRTYPMKDGKIATKDSPDVITQGTGTVYTTIGSTTLNHDSMGNPNMEEIMLIKSPANEMASYTGVSVSENEIKVTIKQLDGLVLDSFTIKTSKPIESDVVETEETNNNEDDNSANIILISVGVIIVALVALVIVLIRRKAK